MMIIEWQAFVPLTLSYWLNHIDYKSLHGSAGCGKTGRGSPHNAKVCGQSSAARK